MKKLISEIQYQYEMLIRFIRNRNFYCQSEIEGNDKCKNQCEHCKEYYKPLE